MNKCGAVLLFGTFNPFTNAHLLIGEIAKKQFPEYDVWYIPAKASFMSGYKKLDNNEIFSEEERFDLVRGSIEGHKDFYISDVEFKGIVDGKTFNTVAYFRSELGYHDVVLCFGTDKVDELETWYHGQDLIRENYFLIITRDGESLESRMTEYTLKYRDNFIPYVKEKDEVDSLSATDVRRAIRDENWEFVRASVPAYVYDRLRSQKK